MGRKVQILRALPEYVDTAEATVVNLGPEGVAGLPVLGRARYARAGGGTVPHVHPGMIEILYCRRGADLSFDYGGRVVPFSPGTVFVSQPEVPHFLRHYPKSLKMDWIWVALPKRGAGLLGLSPAETRWLVARLRAMPASFAAKKSVAQDFRRLWKTYETCRPDGVERALRLREAALALLLSIVDSSAADAGPSAAPSRLAMLIEEMRRDPSRDYPIDALAERAAMSVPRLTDGFRRLAGLPPHQFLLKCRMDCAKAALAGTRQSVAAIANSLGIASARHFAAQFRRVTGTTPLEWRKAHASRS